MTVLFLCRWGTNTGLHREITYVHPYEDHHHHDRCQHLTSDIVLLPMITTVRVFIMFASTRCDSDIDSVTCKIGIACLQRHGSRRVFIPTRIFVITLQLIPNLNDRKQSAH
jgi:uncharacterized membrane protein YdbT with pleckstrin-like domain